jgi:hypothetical protein
MVSIDADNFIKHPDDQPISLRCLRQPANNFNAQRYRISGGVRISVNELVEPGAIIEIETRIQDRVVSFQGRVIWIKESPSKSKQLGLVFDNAEEAYRARMIEQLCHIEHYLRRQNAEGRTLNARHAANEWINRYSPDFPQIGVSLPTG